MTKTKDFLVEKTEQAAQFGKDFVDLAAQLPGAAVNIAKVGYAIATGNPKFDKTFDMNAKPEAQFDSPFGKANSVMIYSTEKDEPDLFAGWKKAEIKKAISLYCVDCKSIGSTTIAGELDYDFLPFKMNKAEVSLSGSIFAQANLGVVAEGKYEKKWKKNIFTQAIPVCGSLFHCFTAYARDLASPSTVSERSECRSAWTPRFKPVSGLSSKC